MKALHTPFIRKTTVLPGFAVMALLFLFPKWTMGVVAEARLTIDDVAVFPCKTLYSNGTQHLIHKIMGDGSPAPPARPGRRHVAQVLSYRGQVSYRNVSKFGDVFGLWKPQHALRAWQVKYIGRERYLLRGIVDATIQETKETALLRRSGCVQGQPCLFLQLAGQGGFYGLIPVYAPAQETVDTRLVPTFAVQKHTAARPLDGQHNFAPPVSGAIRASGEQVLIALNLDNPSLGLTASHGQLL
jgi:hypothetical protein